MSRQEKCNENDHFTGHERNRGNAARGRARDLGPRARRDVEQAHLPHLQRTSPDAGCHAAGGHIRAPDREPRLAFGPQVLDAKERHVLGQFFYVPTRDRTIQEVNKADGKPVVTFHEAAKGMAPAIAVFYYPTDLSGKAFLYPKEQAEQIASASHHAILATASNAAEGGVPRSSPSNRP